MTLTPEQAAYADYFGEFAPAHFEDAYHGTFASERKARDYLLDMWLEAFAVPAAVAGYIDEDKLLRDLLTEYVIRHDDDNFYLFRTY